MYADVQQLASFGQQRLVLQVQTNAHRNRSPCMPFCMQYMAKSSAQPVWMLKLFKWSYVTVASVHMC